MQMCCLQMSDSEPGLSAILRAARSGDLPELEAALASDPAGINKTDSNRVCAIQYAAGRGYLPCVQALLAAGADPDDPAADNCLPLALAAMEGYVPVVNALLTSGASLEATSDDDFGRPLTALQWAAGYGQEGSLRALLAASASLEAPRRGPVFSPALHLAAESGHEGCVRALLEAAAPLEARDSDGNTALTVACCFGQEACMAALVAAGADMVARGSWGTTLKVTTAAHHRCCATALVGVGARTASAPRASLQPCAFRFAATRVRLLLSGPYTDAGLPPHHSRFCAAPTMHHRKRSAHMAWTF